MKKRWKRGQCEDRVRAIVQAYGPIQGVAVARRLWPDSPGWGRPLGRGDQGLARAAAKILRRLEAQGLVETVTIDLGRSCRRIHWQTKELYR